MGHLGGGIRVDGERRLRICLSWIYYEMSPIVLLKVIFSRAAHLAAGIVAGIAALTGMNARMANEVRSGSEFTSTMLAFKRSFFLLSLEILDVV